MVKESKLTIDQSFDWGAVRARLAELEPGVGERGLSEERAQAILARRAKALARDGKADAPPSGVLEVMRFYSAGESFALETRFVREFLRNVRVSRLPGASEFVVGVFNLRGEICPIVSLHALFGRAPEARTAGMGMILGVQTAEFGLIVDDIHGIAHLDRAEIRAAAARSGKGALSAGVTRDGCTILDGDALLSDARLFADSA
jgi:purine-binding chemotaxis protein CheW